MRRAQVINSVVPCCKGKFLGTKNTEKLKYSPNERSFPDHTHIWICVLTWMLVKLQVPNPICSGSTCTWNTTYGSSTILTNLAKDTIALSIDPVPSYAFGCIQKATGSSVPPQGLLGFGRGPLSFLSQSQNLYKSTFSYCLPSFRTLNFSGSLRLGPVGQPLRIKTTPLLKNPRRSSLYYVNLIGIRVGRKIVDIPRSALAFNPTTGAGTIFDSGSASLINYFLLYSYQTLLVLMSLLAWIF